MEVDGTSKIIQEMDEEDESLAKRLASGHDFRRVCEWPSSRIVRVSKGSGGKDRHSKVWTSKGRLRDRRVRLSATTAIQFYDLQDRLGYEQPSKAVDWLLRAAESSISELPSLDSFVDTNKQVVYEMPSSEETNEVGFEVDPSYRQSEKRIIAPEKVKSESKPSLFGVEQKNVKQTSSFTELLTGNFSSTNSSNGSVYGTPLEHFLSNYSEQAQISNSVEPFSVTNGDHYYHQQLHQFSFVPDNNLVTATGENDNYSLNFSVSSGFASGYNRETLQSNSPSMLPHLQRFSPFDGSNVPFFISPAATKGENHQPHHQFAAGLDGPLQLFYGDASWHLDQKGKGKN